MPVPVSLLCLLVLFVPSFSAAGDIDPTCMERFLKSVVLKPGTGALEIENLPDSIPMSLSEEKSRTSFQISLESWTRGSNLTEVKSIVDKIVKNQFKSISEEDRGLLKSSRKLAVLLRNAYVLFGRSHRMPEDLDKFVVRLGKLNDAISVDAKKDSIHAARKLRKSFKKTSSLNLMKDFIVENSNGFDEYIRNVLDTIDEDIEKKELSVEEYHQIRIGLRTLVSYFQLEDVMAPSLQAQNTMLYLRSLSDRMGKVHDKMVTSVLSQGLTPKKSKRKYRLIKLKLEEEIKSKIKAFLIRTNRGIPFR